MERGERIGDEGEEPEEGADGDEPVEIPSGLVGHHAAMPFQFARPGALFFAYVFICLCWPNCARAHVRWTVGGQHFRQGVEEKKQAHIVGSSCSVFLL